MNRRLIVGGLLAMGALFLIRRPKSGYIDRQAHPPWLPGPSITRSPGVPTADELRRLKDLTEGMEKEYRDRCPSFSVREPRVRKT